MSDFRSVAKSYDDSDGEIDSSDDERSALPKPLPRPEEPKAKRSRCLWTDVALEQSMDIARSTYVPTSNEECTIDRGAESYCAVKKPFRDDIVPDFDQHDRRCSPAADDIFGETPEIEEFGVGAQNTRRPPTEYSQETSRFSSRFRGRGRGRGGTVAFKRPSTDGRSSSSNSRDSSVTRPSRGRGRGGLQATRGRGGAFAFKRTNNQMGSNNNLPNLLAEGYSMEKLVAAEFPLGMPLEELATAACKAMGEKKQDTVTEIIKEVGEGKFHTLFEKMRETEKNGGMMTAQQDRRKTPGGVFLHYVRLDPEISQEFKDRIFGVRLLKKPNKSKKKKAAKPRMEDDEQETRVLKPASEVLLAADPEEGELMDED